MENSLYVLCDNPASFTDLCKDSLSKLPVPTAVCNVSGLDGHQIRELLTNSANSLEGAKRALFIYGIEKINENDFFQGILAFCNSLDSFYLPLCDISDPESIFVTIAITPASRNIALETRFPIVPIDCWSVIFDNFVNQP